MENSEDRTSSETSPQNTTASGANKESTRGFIKRILERVKGRENLRGGLASFLEERADRWQAKVDQVREEWDQRMGNFSLDDQTTLDAVRVSTEAISQAPGFLARELGANLSRELANKLAGGSRIDGDGAK